MIFACISVRFKDGIPNVNFNETPTYHEIDPNVIAPRKPLHLGDAVLIKTIGMPQVKLVVDRVKNPRTLGGPICGKATFFTPADKITPWIDQNTAQGGLESAT